MMGSRPSMDAGIFFRFEKIQWKNSTPVLLIWCFLNVNISEKLWSLIVTHEYLFFCRTAIAT